MVYQLDLIKVKETVKEITGGKSKPMLDKLLEDHRLACKRGWLLLAGGSSPLKEDVGLEHAIFD